MLDTELEIPGASREVAQLLERELAWDPELAAMARPLVGALEGLPEEQRKQVIWDRAAPRYRELWALSTRSEKRILLYIASEGFVSPDGWSAVRSLDTRGLAVRDPACRIAGPGLANMIRTQISRAEKDDLEGGDEPSTWSNVRTPFLLLLLLGGLFLFATQREIFNVGVAAAAGAAVTLPMLMRLTSNVWGARGSSNTA